MRRLVRALAACRPCVDPILNIFRPVSHERPELYEPRATTEESPSQHACDAHVKLSGEFFLRQKPNPGCGTF
jgi:hypothetical protein